MPTDLRTSPTATKTAIDDQTYALTDRLDAYYDEEAKAVMVSFKYEIWKKGAEMPEKFGMTFVGIGT